MVLYTPFTFVSICLQIHCSPRIWLISLISTEEQNSTPLLLLFMLLFLPSELPYLNLQPPCSRDVLCGFPHPATASTTSCFVLWVTASARCSSGWCQCICTSQFSEQTASLMMTTKGGRTWDFQICEFALITSDLLSNNALNPKQRCWSPGFFFIEMYALKWYFIEISIGRWCLVILVIHVNAANC